MTTASRPTFDTAKGGQKDLSALSKQYSSRDLPSHNKLKYREPGQGASEDIRGRDFRRDLEDRERIAIREKEKGGSRTDRDRIRAIEASAAQAKRPRQEAIQGNLDADDAADNDSDSSDSDEDDTAELMAELARIKAERAAEAAKKESQQKQREEQIRIENIIQGNPLLQYSGGAAEAPKADLRVKRRWDDDVVFKNCSRSEPDKKERGFINDSLRSDFHRKFMEKYIK